MNLISKSRNIKILLSKLYIKHLNLNQSCLLSSNFNPNDYHAYNEKILDFKKDSPERTSLQHKLQLAISGTSNTNEALFDVPIVIGISI